MVESFSTDPGAAGFTVHYQPVVRLDDGMVVGVEALARWRHSTAGDIAPNIFVPVVERAGLSSELDNFVLDRACADLATLKVLYGPDVSVHVNISASRLGGAQLLAAVEWSLLRHRLRPARLCLEIAAISGITDLHAAADSVRQLRARGVRVALAALGSSFDVLDQLRALPPVDLVKLDATLVVSDIDRWDSAALWRSTIDACDEMSIGAIAVGIEASAQAVTLQRMKCRLGQGYLYGPPLPLPQLLRHVRE